MMENKKKKIILLTYENFYEEIQNILVNNKVEYLIFLYFSSNMKKNMFLLENTKKYFLNSLKDEYLKNVIVLSKRVFS